MQEQTNHHPERQKNMEIVNSAQDFISRNPSTTLRVDISSAEQAKSHITIKKVSALKNDPSQTRRI